MEYLTMYDNFDSKFLTLQAENHIVHKMQHLMELDDNLRPDDITIADFNCDDIEFLTAQILTTLTNPLGFLTDCVDDKIGKELIEMLITGDIDDTLFFSDLIKTAATEYWYDTISDQIINTQVTVQNLLMDENK